MTELQPQGTSTWPSSFTAGLHAALRRRIPPQVDGPGLEELSRDLVMALEQGELTVGLTPERLAAAQASGWLEGAASPLLLQGDRVGWRRWLQAMDQVVAELVERAHAPVPKPVKAATPELS
ncbi:MAG: AAA family ATPase, partial [Cyanobacteriota bacterium]|nr:AAA family ATPase [Cyanobacteriota bacterium]